MSSKNALFQPFKLGELTLKNRMVMSPMTRCRTDYKTGIPNDIMNEYYTQRADAGLIVSECAWVDWKGHGYPGAPGIANEDHANGWKKITQSVHNAGGIMFAQLYHAGRVGHPKINGETPQAPSAIKINDGVKFFTGAGFDDPVMPVEMTEKDILYQIDRFENATQIAEKSGFDGVEIHASNGYLLDNFLRDESNQRSDAYGGSIENRSRMVLEIVDRAIKIYGSQRVGIKISPVGRFNHMYDSDPIALYNYLCKELSKRNIAYISIFEFDGWPHSPKGSGLDQIKNCAVQFKDQISVPIMSTGQVGDIDEAIRRITDKEADLVCFGKPFISNPDLVNRLKNDYPLAQANPETFFTPGVDGYLDYPAYSKSH